MNLIPLPTQPGSTTLSPAELQKIRTSAQEFESMAIGQLLSPMFQTIDHSRTMFGGGEGEEAWRPMWVSALAKQMAGTGGIGLAQPIMQQMIRLQEQRHEPR